MKKICFVIIVCLLYVGACVAVDRGPSTPEERARFVKVTKQLIENPLSDAKKGDLRWAFEFLAEVPDISVSVCGDVINPLLKEKKDESASFTMIYTFAMAEFVIEHPEQSKDQGAINQAAIESVLRAYANAQKLNPKFKLKSLEQFQEMKAKGTLVEYVGKTASKCK